MTLAKAVAARLYGLLFSFLILVVPKAEELDVVLDVLDGEGDERFL
jgi:hypothetical protein